MRKYQRIMNDIKTKIERNEYPPGSKIPSVSQSAQYYGTSRETVVKAYKELIAEHILYTRDKSGHYVAKSEEHVATENALYDLSSGNVLTNLFSLTDAETNLIHGLMNYQTESLNSAINGVPSLILTLQKYLEDFNIFVKPNNIFVTQGVLQVFAIIIRYSQLGKGKILIENPTFSFALRFLDSQEIPYLTIDRTEAGLDLKELRRLFKNQDVRYFYVVPRNHNPLGNNLPRRQVRMIAQLAEEYNVTIIEDDYFGHGQIHSLSETIFENTRTNCVYLSSFTKIVPYLRLGYMIVPERYMERWLILLNKYYLDDYFAPALLSQAMLEIMMKNRSLEKNRYDITRTIEEKRKAVFQQAENWNPEVAQIIEGTAGYYMAIQLNTRINIAELQQKLLKKYQIRIADLKKSFADPSNPHSHGIRISVSKISLAAIPHVLPLIYQCCEEALEKRHT